MQRQFSLNKHRQGNIFLRSFWKLLILVQKNSGKNNDSLCNFVICQAKVELREAFEAADKNGDGILSADEYHDIFQSHGLAIGKRITFNALPQFHEIKTCICMNPAIISLDCKAHLSKWPSDLKINGTQENVTFSGPAFYGLPCGDLFLMRVLASESIK